MEGLRRRGKVWNNLCGEWDRESFKEDINPFTVTPQGYCEGSGWWTLKHHIKVSCYYS